MAYKKTKTECVVLNCGVTARVKEMCQKHYCRQRRHGSTKSLIPGRDIKNPGELFWFYVEKKGDDVCWEWSGGKERWKGA